MLKTLDIVCASLAIFFKQIKSANSHLTDLFGKFDFICELFKNQDNDKFDCFLHLFIMLFCSWFSFCGLCRITIRIQTPHAFCFPENCRNLNFV